jgi:Retrotransposon gag protein
MATSSRPASKKLTKRPTSSEGDDQDETREQEGIAGEEQSSKKTKLNTITVQNDALLAFLLSQRGNDLPVDKFDPTVKDTSFRTWLDLYERTANRHGLSDRYKALYLSMYVVPSVARWIQNLPLHTTEQWPALRNEMLAQFALPEYEEREERKRVLYKCRQDKDEPVRTYALRFQYLLAEIPGCLPGETQVDLFLSGLHPSIRNALLPLGFDDLFAAVDAAATFER